MKNWKRHYNADGVHALWAYTDSLGTLQHVRCDENGWIDVGLLLPDKGMEVQISGHDVFLGAYTSTSYFISNGDVEWRGWSSDVVAAWQPIPLPMAAKS